MPFDQIPGKDFIFDCHVLKAIEKIRFKVLQRCSSQVLQSISNCNFAVRIEASGVAVSGVQKS